MYMSFEVEFEGILLWRRLVEHAQRKKKMQLGKNKHGGIATRRRQFEKGINEGISYM